MSKLGTSQYIILAADTVISITRSRTYFVCGTSYVERFANTDGRNSWVTVIGYDNDQWTDFDLVCTLTKPTKRQLRKLKREYR